mgnify:CR=1 FL=1
MHCVDVREQSGTQGIETDGQNDGGQYNRIQAGQPGGSIVPRRAVLAVGCVGNDKAGQDEKDHDRITADIQVPYPLELAVRVARIGQMRGNDYQRSTEPDGIEIEGKPAIHNRSRGDLLTWRVMRQIPVHVSRCGLLVRQCDRPRIGMMSLRPCKAARHVSFSPACHGELTAAQMQARFLR